MSKKYKMEKYSIMSLETDLGLLFNSFSFNAKREPWIWLDAVGNLIEKEQI